MSSPRFGTRWREFLTGFAGREPLRADATSVGVSPPDQDGREDSPVAAPTAAGPAPQPSVAGARINQLRSQLERSLQLTESVGAAVDTQQLAVQRAQEQVAVAKAQLRERSEQFRQRSVDAKERMIMLKERSIAANERVALVKERSEVLKERLATSRAKLAEVNSFYTVARRYFGLYRQGLLMDEALKSDVDFAADAYLCLLPSTVPAGLSLRDQFGGRVYCDCVENVEVHKHSLAPKVHPPALQLINLAAFGSLMSVDGILTVGDALGSTLRRFGPPVHVAPNFRRFEQPSPAEELRRACGLQPNDRLLFASGNVVVGFEPVIEAMSRLPKDIHLAAFVKLKPVEYETEVRDLIKRHGLESRVHFFDFVEYAKLARLAADADIGLITSDISNPNGAVALPNRLFDYVTAGLPVIAPPMPDVVTIVNQHGIGRTLETVTADEWAQAITHVLDDLPAFTEAVHRARRELTWERGEDRLVEFLGHPKSVTLLGFRDLSRYQRFLRIARTLTSRGVEVKALFLAEDPAPVSIPEARFYHFSDRYGRGSGPTRVPGEEK